MTRIKNNNNNNYLTIIDNKIKPIIMVRHSNLRLPLSSQSSSTSIANKKDNRLELIEIPKGLIEILQEAGFTVETILEYRTFSYCRNTRNRVICWRYNLQRDKESKYQYKI